MEGKKGYMRGTAVMIARLRLCRLKVMDETQFASDITRKVVSDMQVWIAAIGLVGVVIGSGLTILGNLVLH